MKALEDKICAEGEVLPGNILKVGSFLNHQVDVDFDSGVIHNLTRNESYQAAPFPPFIQNIMKNNGLMNAIRKEGE